MSKKVSKELPTPAAPEPEWAAFVAIDWADQKHYWQLVAAGSQKQERGQLDHTPEAVTSWAANLTERFGGAGRSRCVWSSRGAPWYICC
jgi:hypothetical protein